MNKSLHGRVAAIAFGTRLWVQQRADRSGYNADSLQGWCAIGSAELCRRLNVEGIAAQIHMWVSDWGECHCFCVVEDHVVDITATQFREFSNKEVVIMPMLEAFEYEMYRGTEVFGCSAELRRYQKRNRWPSCQVCYC